MIWNLGKVTPYGECYPRDLFRQIVSNPMKGAKTLPDNVPARFFLRLERKNLSKSTQFFFLPHEK